MADEFSCPEMPEMVERLAAQIGFRVVETGSLGMDRIAVIDPQLGCVAKCFDWHGAAAVLLRLKNGGISPDFSGVGCA